MHLGGFSSRPLIFNQFGKILFNDPIFSSVLPSQISQSLSQFWTVRRGKGVDNSQQEDNIKCMWIHVAMDNR